MADKPRCNGRAGEVQLVPEMPTEQIDAIADRPLFGSRETSATSPDDRWGIGRKKVVGPSVPLSIRVPLDIGRRFVLFCEENRYSYREGIEELMYRAGLIQGPGS
jgi:hypothetical protein